MTATPPPTGSTTPLDQTMITGPSAPQAESDTGTDLPPVESDATIFVIPNVGEKTTFSAPADADRTMFVPAAGRPKTAPRSEPPKAYASPTTPSDRPESEPSQDGPLSIGQSFGTRYHIIRVLGVGGMGAVYQAWDAELGVAVAIKVVRPEITADPSAADMERRCFREMLARQVPEEQSAFTTWARSRASIHPILPSGPISKRAAEQADFRYPKPGSFGRSYPGSPPHMPPVSSIATLNRPTS